MTVEAENFGSYKKLDFEFLYSGLSLISGPTGAGKSTLQDLVPWCLFGITAKDGNADDIRPWGSDEPTQVRVWIELNNIQVIVVRVRGTQKQNDLYWVEYNGNIIRGKDIPDTQKLLNERLGCDSYTYMTSCYYNEYNPASLFFSKANASDRRILFESVADLSFPTQLRESISESQKALLKETQKIDKEISKITDLIELTSKYQENYAQQSDRWENRHVEAIESLSMKNSSFLSIKDNEIKDLIKKRDEFEQNRNKTLLEIQTSYEHNKKDLESTGDAMCPTCGESNKRHWSLSNKVHSLHLEFERTTTKENPFTDKIEEARGDENPYEQLLNDEKSQINPFLSSIEKVLLEKTAAEQKLKVLSEESKSLKHKYFSLQQLHELTQSLKSELLHNTISTIEATTNSYLDKYFDSEIRVCFSVTYSDNLHVTIHKNGNECSFKQLSSGQKGLLKLCFAISVMNAASSKSGVHFNTLFFDEALTNLDVNLKLKSYALFQSLLKQHETILVIEHNNELANCFENQYTVSINNDISQIEKL